jgi:hypothetical protein
VRDNIKYHLALYPEGRLGGKSKRNPAQSNQFLTFSMSFRSQFNLSGYFLFVKNQLLYTV